MSVWNPDPFDSWATADIQAAHLALELACGRAKSVLRQKHRGKLCALAQITEAQLNKRNASVPQAPYKA
jgi:hypothetical protein